MTERTPRRALGALWMLLPAAAAALGAALLFQRPNGTRDVTPPAVADPDGQVAAFGGRLDGGPAGALVARLAPLHAAPERQAFEAAALAARLDLESGEPWRLSVRFERAGGASGPPLRLGAVEVLDEGGSALSSIPPAASTAPGATTPGLGAADPLRSLLAPPGGSLGPGEEVDWILWGRRPGPGARLAGLELPDGSSGLGAFALEPRTVRRSELELPVARLDRPASEAPGKSASVGTSE